MGNVGNVGNVFFPAKHLTNSRYRWISLNDWHIVTTLGRCRALPSWCTMCFSGVVLQCVTVVISPCFQRFERWRLQVLAQLRSEMGANLGRAARAGWVCAVHVAMECYGLMVFTCFDMFLQALTHSNCLLKGLCSWRTSTTSTSTQASTVLQKSCGNNSSIQRSMRQNCISWRWRLWSQTNHWVFFGLRILTSLSHTDTALPWHAAGWYSLIFVDIRWLL